MTHPDGPLCLVCSEVRTWSEGQLCEACVEKGHRVENDTVIFNLSYFMRPSSSRFTLDWPVE